MQRYRHVATVATADGTLTVEWMNAETALKHLRCSQRTLDRMTQNGKIKTRQEPLPGRRPVTLYNGADVEQRSSQLLAGQRKLGLPMLPAPVAPVPTLTLSYREARALSGLPERLLREAVAAGKLNAFPVRGSHRISRASLERYCAGV